MRSIQAPKGNKLAYLTHVRMIFGTLLIGVLLVAVACGSVRSGGGTARLETISTVSQFQRAFDAERGTARLLVLLSPTWHACQASASWVQKNILRRYPSADIRVLVVWIPMLRGDANPRVAKLLVDHRATHYWDVEGRLGLAFSKLGLAFARQLGYGGTAAWDIFLVYRPGAKWGEVPAAVGSPVVSESGALVRALRPYL